MKIAILGYGVEGKSVERYFSKDPENEIEIFDKITKEDIPKLGLNRFDWVFRTPSLHPFPADNLTSATRYFFDNCPAPIIGVTGTKGKGTTCSFTAAILKALGKNVHFLGNVGVPSLDVLDTIQPDDVVVYETSGVTLRKSVSNYNISFLNLAISVIASITMMCYIMYTVSPEVVARFNSPYV